MSNKKKQYKTYKSLVILIGIISGAINGYELCGIKCAIIEAFFLGLVIKDIGRNLYQYRK